MINEKISNLKYLLDNNETNMLPENYDKLINAYNKIKDNPLIMDNIYYRYDDTINLAYEIVIVSSVELASFKIYSHNEELRFYTEIEDDYRGLGLSRLLQFILLIKLQERNVNFRDDSIIGICADASDGFWKSLGMFPGRYNMEGERADSNICRTGFDLEFTYNDWYKYIFGTSLSIPAKRRKMAGGLRKSRRRHRRKSRRRRRRKKSRRRRRRKK